MKREEMALEMLGLSDPKDFAFYKALPLMMVDYEGFVKNRLTIRFTPKERAEKYDYARQIFCGDICLTTALRIKGHDGQPRLCKITRHMMWIMGVDEEQLFKDAVENTKKLSDPVFFTYADLGATFSDGFMKVCFDRRLVAGSAVIALPETRKAIVEKTEDDSYIIPSSTEELILIPASCRNKDKIQKLIHEVNSECVDDTDYLSDNLFLFKRDSREIVMVE